METADLSEHGTQRLEMKGDQEMPGSRVFKKPTYLNVYGSRRHQQYSRSNGVMQSEPSIVNNSLSQRKVSISISIVVSGRITSLLLARMFYIDRFSTEAQTQRTCFSQGAGKQLLQKFVL